MSRPTAPLAVRDATAPEHAAWDDLVRRFPNHRVAHTSAWLRSLEASGLGTALRLVLVRDADVVGCFPGLLAQTGPWRVFGSPRAGWQSGSMGPAFDPARTDADEIVRVTVPFLERQYDVDLIELMHDGLDEHAMREHGFASEEAPTFRADLFPGEEARAFRALKSSARRNIQRAERLGLEVRIETDECFVAEHYDQLREVYDRGGNAITFGKERLLACFRSLRDSGQLVAVSVYLPGGRVNIATGTFFIEDRELTLWMWAHRTHYRWYRPTELMTWSVMRRAMASGCDTFDLMGRGDFKAKFGAQLEVSRTRWIRSRKPWLMAARRLAVVVYRGQQAVRGRVTRIVSAGRERRRRTVASACVMGNLDLVQALGQSGVRSTVFAPPGAPARYSRFNQEALAWADAWNEPERVVDLLLAHGVRQAEPPALFYDEDRSVLLVSRHRDRLAQSFRFVLPDARLVEDLVDKARFQALAARLHLPVPPAIVLGPGSEFPAPDAVTWPAIVKPLVRRPDLWQAVGDDAKAVPIATADDLARRWPQLMASGLTFLIQQHIPGDETRIESYHVYVDAAGAVAAEFTGRKLRTWPATFGDSTALTLTDAGDVAELGRIVARSLGLRGVAKMDFKRGPDGQLHLLEVNPRFTLWHGLAARAGINIPAIVFADLTAQPRPAICGPRGGASWCRPWTDWRAARAADIPLPTWLRWVAACDARAGLSLTDPAPLLRAGVHAVVAALRPGGRPATPVAALPLPRAAAPNPAAP